MGNFTSAAHIARVSPQARRKMLDFTRKTLNESGLPADAGEEKWPLPLALGALLGRLRDLADLALAVVRGKRFNSAVLASARPDGRKFTERGAALLCAVGWELSRSVDYVGHDLLNTIAGDLSEAGRSTRVNVPADANATILRLSRVPPPTPPYDALSKAASGPPDLARTPESRCATRQAVKNQPRSASRRAQPWSCVVGAAAPRTARARGTANGDIHLRWRPQNMKGVEA